MGRIGLLLSSIYYIAGIKKLSFSGSDSSTISEEQSKEIET